MQYHQIRWRENDVNELKRIIKNYNQKLRRLRKKGVDADILPPSVTYNEIKDNIATRNDLNKTINKYKRFSKRGAEKVITNSSGLSKTSWEFKETALSIRNINIRRSKERKRVEDLQVKSRGKKQGYTREYLPNERLDELSNKTNRSDKISSNEEWNKFVESVEKQMTDKYSMEKKEMYKENYIKALKREMGGIPNLDKYIKELKKVSPDEFMKAYYEEQEGAIDFIYDPIELQNHFDMLVDIWVTRGFISGKL